MQDEHGSSAAIWAMVDRLCAHQRGGWLAGRPEPAEQYLQQHSVLATEPEALFCLVYNEWLIREELGETVDPQEFFRRFPELRQRFEEQLELHRVLEAGDEPFAESPNLTQSGASPPHERTARTTYASPGSVDPFEPPPPSPPFRGTERFEVLRRLGAGAMGAVDAAHDRHWQQEVAIKTLHHVNPLANERIKQEFRVLADLVHPNLVQLYELFDSNGRHFFTLELIEGLDFVTYCRSGAPAERSARPNTDPLRDGLRQLAQGLMFLHRSDRLHCDIKSSNVLVTGSGRVVILDFGLARWSGWAKNRVSSGLRGTPPYLAPELLAGRPATMAVDWYAVGVLLYVALTGEQPFGKTAAEIMKAKRTGKVPQAPLALDPQIPSDLSQLCLELLEPDPYHRASGTDVLQVTGGTATIPLGADLPFQTASFIGRRAERDRLWAALRRVEAGRPAGVLVLGSSGVGKTALMRQLEQELTGHDGVLVLSARCYQGESLPYKALDATIQSLCRHLQQEPPQQVARLLPDDLPALVQMFPALGRLEPVAQRYCDATGSNDRQALRWRAFRALRQLLARVAEEYRVVLLMDDLHWGDPDSGELMGELFAGPSIPRLLLVACSRSGVDETSPCVTALGSQRCRSALGLEELRLENLSSAEARELAAQQFVEQARGAPERAELLARHSKGNPFLLLELARSAAEMSESRLPDAGEHLVRSRVAQLPEEPRRLVQTIAIAGHPLQALDACRAARLQGDRQKVLGRLRAERLIRTHGQADGYLVEPYHDQIREGLTAAMPQATRQQYHLQLAQTLEATDEPNPEHLARHYSGANRPDRASRYWMLAAERSAEALAFDDAAGMYRMALATRDRDPDKESELRQNLADSLAGAGRGAEAAEEYLRAERCVADQEKHRLRRLASEQYLKAGHVEKGYTVLLPLLAQRGLRLPKSPLAKFMMGLALDVALRLRGLAFQERRAEEVPAGALERLELCWITALAASVHDYRQGIAVQKLHLLESLRWGEPRQVGVGLALEAYFLAGGSPGAVRRAQKLLQRAESLAHDSGDERVRLYAFFIGGLEAVMQGRWRESAETCDQTRDLLKNSHQRYWYETNCTDHCQAIAWFYRGEFRALSQRVPQLLTEALQRGDRFATHWFRIGCCNAAWLVSDHPERARQELDHMIRDFPPQRYSLDHFLLALAELNLRLYCGAGREAWDHLQVAWEEVRKSGTMAMRFFRVQMLALRASCALAALGSGLDDRKLLRRARRDARKLESETLHWAKPMAQLIRAQVALRCNDIPSALEQLRYAADGFQHHEMDFHAAAAQYRLGNLLGGEEGETLLHAAHTFTQKQTIRNPKRMLGMATPGFGHEMPRFTHPLPHSGAAWASQRPH